MIREVEQYKKTEREFIFLNIAGALFNMLFVMVLLAVFHKHSLNEGLQLIYHTLNVPTWFDHNLDEIFTTPLVPFTINACIVLNTFTAFINLVPLPGSDGFSIIQACHKSMSYRFRWGKLLIRLTAALVVIFFLAFMFIIFNSPSTYFLFKSLIILHGFIILYAMMLGGFKMNDIVYYVEQFQ